VAQKLDGQAASFIETGQYNKLGPNQACGYLGIVGFLASKLGRNARVSRLGMADSSAVTQDANRVVGYGAWAFFAPDCDILPQKQRETILRAGREGTGMFLKACKHPKIKLNSFAMPLRGYIPSFITFTHNERLRGCIGSLAAHTPLISDVVANSIKAATSDSRFAPLQTGKQLAKLRMKVSVLSRAIALDFTDQDDLLSQIIPRVSGLILQFGTRRSTFLPIVWDKLPDRKRFLDGLKVKAGLPYGFWSKEIKIMQFQTESFSDN
jgi:AmmeMemoRadiSam system protein A